MNYNLIIQQFILEQNQDCRIDGKNIQKLGIQAYPGSKFTLNNSQCEIGPTGIFDFDFSDCQVYPTQFFMQNSNETKIIIDVIILEAEGGSLQ